MKRLVLAPKARANLFDIDAYIAERNPLAAERLIERLIQAMRMLVRMPMVGQTCEDLGLPAMRRFVVEKHHIFYVLGINDLRVVRVLHGRRDVTTEVRQ